MRVLVCSIMADKIKASLSKKFGNSTTDIEVVDSTNEMIRVADAGSSYDRIIVIKAFDKLDTTEVHNIIEKMAQVYGGAELGVLTGEESIARTLYEECLVSFVHNIIIYDEGSTDVRVVHQICSIDYADLVELYKNKVYTPIAKTDDAKERMWDKEEDMYNFSNEKEDIDNGFDQFDDSFDQFDDLNLFDELDGFGEDEEGYEEKEDTPSTDEAVYTEEEDTQSTIDNGSNDTDNSESSDNLESQFDFDDVEDMFDFRKDENESENESSDSSEVFDGVPNGVLEQNPQAKITRKLGFDKLIKEKEKKENQSENEAALDKNEGYQATDTEVSEGMQNDTLERCAVESRTEIEVDTEASYTDPSEYDEEYDEEYNEASIEDAFSFEDEESNLEDEEDNSSKQEEVMENNFDFADTPQQGDTVYIDEQGEESSSYIAGFDFGDTEPEEDTEVSDTSDIAGFDTPSNEETANKRTLDNFEKYNKDKYEDEQTSVIEDISRSNIQQQFGKVEQNQGVAQESIEDLGVAFEGKQGRSIKKSLFGKVKGVKATLNNKKEFSKNKQLQTIMNTYQSRGCVITVTGTRGTGKTTTAFSLANIIHKMGYLVLLVDLDCETRGQSFINKDAYEIIHEGDTASSGIVSAVNTYGNELGRSVSILRNGFHILSMGLAAKMDKSDNLVQGEKLAQFIQSAKGVYNFVIIDVALDKLTGPFKDALYSSDDLLVTVGCNTHDITDFMLSITNIEDDNIQETMFKRSNICFTKVDKIRSLYGKKINKPEDILGIMDYKVQELIGGEAEFQFIEMRPCGVIRYSSNYEEYWFNQVNISDTTDGESIYLNLLKDLLIKTEI